MSSPQQPVLNISLFALLAQQIGDTLPLVQCSKATLVHLSHTLEDMVLSNRIPALLFTGFQESSHWREETERYRALAEVAQQVCIFAGGQLPPESNASELHITLTGDDPLRQEWFVLILSSEFTVLLCGQDRHEPSLDEATRQFNTFWSFDPTVVGLALDVLERVIERYRPERLQALQEARARFGLQLPNPTLMTHFSAEMIRYQEELLRTVQRSNALLDEQLRWRESMTQTLVHDLRTPLQGLILGLDVIDQSAEYGRDAVADTLLITRRTAVEIESLVQMLLDTNQLEIGRLLIQWQPINLTQFVEMAAESIKTLFDVGSVQLEVKISPAARLIWGDQTLLNRVLQNLLGNALKFTPAGGTIFVEASPSLTGDNVELRVRDTGVGIAPSVLPHIFDRNIQAQPRDRRGNGLGLYFCRLAVEAHGGTIRAASQLGRGTTITVQLPIRPKLA